MVFTSLIIKWYGCLIGHGIIIIDPGSLLLVTTDCKSAMAPVKHGGLQFWGKKLI